MNEASKLGRSSCGKIEPANQHTETKAAEVSTADLHCLQHLVCIISTRDA